MKNMKITLENEIRKNVEIDVWSVFREIFSTFCLLIYGCGVALSLECTLTQVSIGSRTEVIVQVVLLKKYS